MVSTLSARLFLLIAAVTLAGLVLLSHIVVGMHTQHLEEQVIHNALRLSDTLRRSMRYSMLKNQKDAVYQAIQTVGEQPGIDRIRIFNKEGRIMFSTNPGERGETVDKKAEACTSCHTTEQPIPRLDGRKLTRIFEAKDGHRVLGLITPVYNEKSCSAAGCHPGAGEQQVLGVFDVQTSLAGIDRALQDQNRRFLLLTYLLMLVIALTCGLFVWWFVHVPVQTLIRGTERLAAGELDFRIQTRSRTEIGRLASSLNQMAEELERAQRQLTDWTHTLEQRVDERTRSLRQAQTQLVHNEKMASLGALSAVVAHEVNNPLSGVLTYAKLVRKMMGDNGPDPKRLPEIIKYLKTIETETARCGSIVKNLLEFSRQSGLIASEVNLNELLSKTLFLIGHKLELQEVRLAKDLSPTIPTILCDADQIQQALLAILINAVEAMPDGGELRVSTRAVEPEAQGDSWVEVTVADNGVGIPEEVIPRLFEPFFTTKQDKKGVGLGLSVVYGIVKRHQGRLDVKSEPGKGTTFVIALPQHAEIQQDVLLPETGEAFSAGDSEGSLTDE